jgi:hypothetical protein
MKKTTRHPERRSTNPCVFDHRRFFIVLLSFFCGFFIVIIVTPSLLIEAPETGPD